MLNLSGRIRFAIATGNSVSRAVTDRAAVGSDLRINANTVAKVYASLERAAVLETRRGVGHVRDCAARGSIARPSRSRKHLRELADHFIAETGTRGFSLDDVI